MRLFLAAVALASLVGLAGCDSGADASEDLAAPHLRSPANGASFPALSLVEFSWRAVEGASAYEISLEYGDYPSANESEVVLDTVEVGALTELGPVRWRVRGRSDEAPGPWSELRELDVIGTAASTVAEFSFVFSTENLAVGQDLRIPASTLFAPPLNTAIQATGATVADLRNVDVDAFRITITNPAGATLDDFSNWTLLLSTGSTDTPITEIDEPAPDTEASEVEFVRPDDWLSRATDSNSQIVLSLQTNPRTPRSADVHVGAILDMTAVLNYSD